ncbi:MAG: hypothetical protein FWD83_07030, partial [Promicromonosporaceae bacterium]|nr:hypothetical protein [Promicromonosporaceae bacterium]
LDAILGFTPPASTEDNEAFRSHTTLDQLPAIPADEPVILTTADGSTKPGWQQRFKERLVHSRVARFVFPVRPRQGSPLSSAVAIQLFAALFLPLIAFSVIAALVGFWQAMLAGGLWAGAWVSLLNAGYSLAGFVLVRWITHRMFTCKHDAEGSCWVCATHEQRAANSQTTWARLRLRWAGPIS